VYGLLGLTGSVTCPVGYFGTILVGKRSLVIYKLAPKRGLERRVALRQEIWRSDVELLEDIVMQLRRAREAYPYYFGGGFYKEVNELHDEVVRAIMNVYYPSSHPDFSWEDLIDVSVFRNPGKYSPYKSEPWRKANRRTDIEERIRLNEDHNAYRVPNKHGKKEESLDPKDYGFE